jgi:hypothetical protein
MFYFQQSCPVPTDRSKKIKEQIISRQSSEKNLLTPLACLRASVVKLAPAG